MINKDEVDDYLTVDEHIETEKETIKMAAKIVLRRQVRTSKDIAWYKATDDQKTAAKVVSQGTGRSVTGYRNYKLGLKNYNIKFFPSVALHTAHYADAGIKAIIDARKAYNTANGIVEKEITIDLPNMQF